MKNTPSDTLMHSQPIPAEDGASPTSASQTARPSKLSPDDMGELLGAGTAPASATNMKSKDELALEDRRRRNRETQRAIRQRKAAKLQDSEVKVVLHEQEIEKLKQKLAQAEQEASELRQQLESCTCLQHVVASRPTGSPVLHDRQQPEQPAQVLGKRKILAGPELDESASVRETNTSPAYPSRPRPSVLQPLPAASPPGVSSSNSTTTTLASLPLKDLTQAATIIGNENTWSKPSSSSSIPSRTSSMRSVATGSGRSDSQYSMTPSSPPSLYSSSFFGGKQSTDYDFRSIPPLAKPAVVGSPLAIESSMSSLSTAEGRSRHYSSTGVPGSGTDIQHTHRDAYCPGDCPCYSGLQQRVSGASTSSTVQLPPLGMALDSSAFSPRYGSSYHGYSPSSSRPPSAHTARDQRPTLPPLLRHPSMSATRNGKGKSTSYPVTAIDYHQVSLPPLVSRSSHLSMPMPSPDYSSSFSPGAYSRASSIYEEPPHKTSISSAMRGVSPPVVIKEDIPMDRTGDSNSATLPSMSTVVCCNGFIKCDEETDGDLMRKVGARSTMDDFQELFGERPETQQQEAGGLHDTYA